MLKPVLRGKFSLFSQSLQLCVLIMDYCYYLYDTSNQGSKGLIDWWIKNIPNYDTQNYPFSRLQLVVETLGHP